MKLKEEFEKSDLNLKTESLDLITSYSNTMRFLGFFQDALFDRERQSVSVHQIYLDYLYSLGLINTVDDIPPFFPEDAQRENSKQAARNHALPMGLGTIAAYMCMNLVLGKEIASDKLPTAKSEKALTDWFLSDFIQIKETNPGALNVKRVITRLRNSISHKNFKIEIPESERKNPDVRERVKITFYDSDLSKQNNEFLAIATFGTIEKLMKKIHEIEYYSNTYPVTDLTLSTTKEIESYIGQCFEHFTRAYRNKNLKYCGIEMATPEEAFLYKTRDNLYELSKSETFVIKIKFIFGDNVFFEFLDIPYINEGSESYTIVLGRRHFLGNYPLNWFLFNEASPIFLLDKKILNILDGIVKDKKQSP
mgnify:CR=1 FL=1